MNLDDLVFYEQWGNTGKESWCYPQGQHEKRKRSMNNTLLCVIKAPDNTPCISGGLSACSRVLFMERLPKNRSYCT